MAENEPDAVQDQLKCFVICPFGGVGTEIRERSDDIFNNLIKPIAEEFGYKPYRLLDDSRPGEISPQIIEALYEADLVVADLSGQNANVFYELALRHSTGKPFIHMVDEPGSVPFDVAPLNVVPILTDGFGDVENTRKELRGQFKAVQDGKANFDHPVSRHQDRVRINEEGTPVEKKVAEILERVGQLEKSDIARSYTSSNPSQPVTNQLVAAILRGDISPTKTPDQTIGGIFGGQPSIRNLGIAGLKGPFAPDDPAGSDRLTEPSEGIPKRRPINMPDDDDDAGNSDDEADGGEKPKD